MISPRGTLTLCFLLVSVFSAGETATTTEAHKYTCSTFGSGVIQPFNGSSFYVRSNCPFTLTRFTHNRVDCDITMRRGDSGLLVHVEIIINKIRTVLQNGSILVEGRSVSLPYDHTYQHIFQYGVFTKLRSSLLPLSVTWHNVPGGIDSLRVEVEQQLSGLVTGLCGKHNATAHRQQLVAESTLADDTCQTRDPAFADNKICRDFFSYTLECLQARTLHYIQLCEENLYTYEANSYIACAFFREVVQQCGNSSHIWNIWRTETSCKEPTCPGDLIYAEQGPAFAPSCSNPDPAISNQDLVASCVCPKNKLRNDVGGGFGCVSVPSCPCVFAGKSYSTGDTRSTKCQTCMCDSGKWHCSANFCPATCVIEGHFVTTIDGKRYTVPGKCTYVASQGYNWTVITEFYKATPTLKTVILHLFQEVYTFSHNMVKIGEDKITELHTSDHALVFWESSMYVQVHTSLGLKIQVQVSPQIQLYLTPPTNHTGPISGLCGNSNSDTRDDFTTSSGIVENSAQPFALSWTLGTCAVNILDTCINTDNEIFAEEKCSILNDPNGMFAKCHHHIPTDHYHKACIQRTCNCVRRLEECICVALGNYAKACAGLGIFIGDWRKATNCTVKCENNQEFSYNIRACNHTCRSLSGSDPRCGLDDMPVDGCGCPEGTHLNLEATCTTKADCFCNYYGGTTPPGPVVIDGRQCICEDGELHCSKDCGCRNGKVCVHCAEFPVNTARKTCDSLSKPVEASVTCDSGCYCPYDQYEDHLGNCVSVENCTCIYSGRVFTAGQSVKSNCKTCICGQGQWSCRDEPCSGKCQVYGNGHYQTFDSNLYRFDGHCQYTFVEDACGTRNGTFSIRIESVPCCDEALTCSRSVVFDLQGIVTLTLSDMKVTRRHHDGWTLGKDLLYTVRSVGLYIIVSVPSKGITLIWDKHTRLTVELQPHWRNQVCGLCGNFDASEMNDLQLSDSAMIGSPMTFGNSWKATTPPCSDVTTEIFPCERNSYCSAWAQRRCMILKGDTFKQCHLLVEPEPYYHACVQESCSCEFEGKFLGFCTAVAAYAEACSDQLVCINWRTPDLCPVYCDYYNEQGQCRWHYEACGESLTCGDNYVSHKLEGCYPRCSKEAPYYDANTGKCTILRNCTCYFNDTVVDPGSDVLLDSVSCRCENGTVKCPPLPTTTAATTILSTTPTTAASTTPEIPSTISTAMTTTPNISTTTTSWSTEIPSTSMATITTPPTTTETESSIPSTTSTAMTTTPNISTTTTSWSTEIPSTSMETITTPPTTTKTESSIPSTTSTAMTTTPNISTTTTSWSTEIPSTSMATITTPPTTTETESSIPSTIETRYTTPTTSATSKSSTFGVTTESTTAIQSTTAKCECVDLKNKRRWVCGQTWTEDCFNKVCINGMIESTQVSCPKMTIPSCPRQRATKVSDGCCETWKCDCQCEVYGDPHYISFQGVPFDFLEDCTYVLVEERLPQHHLTIAVDNYFCIPGLDGSCAKSIILKYKNNTASLKIDPQLFTVKATLNNETIKPPYKEDGYSFETTDYIVSIHLPEIRSYVSLSPSWTVVVSLAMEHFLNNTQGQCGVCGVGSCIRKGGPMEEDGCCDKTAYDWVYDDPMKPACFSAPRNVPCHSSTPVPTTSHTTTTSCPAMALCELLDHPVFSNCSKHVNLIQKKNNCRFDSCRTGVCSSLEQAAEECKKAGFCISWRELTSGRCNLTCAKGLVHDECRFKLDDFCYRGAQIPGASLEHQSTGCFCPSGQFRAGNHSDVCVSECHYCTGSLGEPKKPGEVWQSNCHLCTCNKQTQSEECVERPPVTPVCSPGTVLVNTSCCGEPLCVEKTCSFNGKTYKMGDRWWEAEQPCMSFSCSNEGIQTVTKVCPEENCQEEDRIWDHQHCCFTCNQSCAPKLTSMNVTVGNCSSVALMPVCQGQCASGQSRVVFDGNLQVEQTHQSCQKRRSERRPLTLQCLDLTSRTHVYEHITACDCRDCVAAETPAG